MLKHLGNLLQSGHITAGSLDTVLGKLSFASRIVVPGRIFTRCLWDLKRCYHNAKLYFTLKIPDDCGRNLWWQVLLQKWNGRSFFLYTKLTSATDLGIFTDDSGAGWGVYCGDQHRWTSGIWSARFPSHSIEL